MVELNLTPWRLQKVKYDKKRQQISVMLGVLLAVSGWSLWHIKLQQKLEEEREQLKILQLNLTQLNAQKAKQNRVVNKGLTPDAWFQFLNLLAKDTESGVCYQEMTFDNQIITLSGKSWSMPILLTTLKKIKAPEQFSSYQVSQILRKDSYSMLDYRVNYKEIDRVKES